MRLSYKPQSAYPLCPFATQAIAVNSLIGTNYTDRDFVKASATGLFLGYPLFEFEVRRAFPKELSHDEIMRYAEGVMWNLADTKRVPATTEELVEGWKARMEQYFKKNEALVREGKHPHTERKINALEAEQFLAGERERIDSRYRDFLAHIRDPSVTSHLGTLQQNMRHDVLEPVAYHFTVGTEQPKDDMGLSALVGGTVERSGGAVDDVRSPDVVVRFPSRRSTFGMKDKFIFFGHWWVIDRLEGNNAILLDTNAHEYGSPIEVAVDRSLITEDAQVYRKK